MHETETVITIASENQHRKLLFLPYFTYFQNVAPNTSVTYPSMSQFCPKSGVNTLKSYGGLSLTRFQEYSVKNSKKTSRLARIVDAAETLFGEKVLKTHAPGGDGRSSFRLKLESQYIIGTLRPNFRRTHLEAHVLNTLAEFSDDQPRCLGVVGDIMFQSDVGTRRLNMEIADVSLRRQVDLADDAVAGIFRIQAAARKSNLNAMMPHLGNNDAWISSLVNSTKDLEAFGPGISAAFDRNAARARVETSHLQFVKWDCRSGNAALDESGKLRWFDFEYAGLRHGAEDFAWLIADESWPVDPDLMLQIVVDNFDHSNGLELNDYLDFLSAYTALHCVQRLKLIQREAQKHGWKTKRQVRKYDDAGVHPEFAAQLCAVGVFFADRSPVTAALTRNFEAAQKSFLGMGERVEDAA